MKYLTFFSLFFSFSLFAEPLRLFPNVHGIKKGQIKIAMFDHIAIGKELRNELRDHWKKNNGKGKDYKSTGTMNTELTGKVFTALGIKKDMWVFTYNLTDNTVTKSKVADLGNIVVHMNEAGDSDFGSLGLVNKADVERDKAITHIGYKNPFLAKGTMRPMVWETTNEDKFQYQPNPEYETSYDSEFYEYEGEGLKIHYNLTTVHTPTPGYTATRYGIWINGKKGKPLKFEGTGEYSYPPTLIWVGKFLKGYSEVFITDTIGMGDCGLLILSSKAGLKQLPLYCGWWGC